MKAATQFLGAVIGGALATIAYHERGTQGLAVVKEIAEVIGRKGGEAWSEVRQELKTIPGEQVPVKRGRGRPPKALSAASAGQKGGESPAVGSSATRPRAARAPRKAAGDAEGQKGGESHPAPETHAERPHSPVTGHAFPAELHRFAKCPTCGARGYDHARAA